ncbi:type II toxin-antitoxin system MqsR family toxin [Planococcus liqunii]|uniref:type II toxin-antitoxin system MqsR family toxin n=1 Tax=Planococcus liqunii TaxID=3058394 RepID=UPI002623B19B|nr:type II toxin-antitoxin system MqsR family toxin [Planococcus sp. N056]WKA50205.1 type II toxin-antitoxin system MqsR family toxin [Planococcus sp. N056]
MKDEWTESKEAVEEHFEKVRRVLSAPDCQFNFQRRRRDEDPLDPFTNMNTLLALDYDEEDVICELIELRVGDYWKTVTDLNRRHTPPFWIFEKKIKGKSVYIKFKIRDEANKQIFCMSFHFSKEPVSNKPYSG